MSTFMVIKVCEWLRAIDIIKEEVQLDEEVVKIHLWDQIASYRPEIVALTKKPLLVFFSLICNSLVTFYIIPLLTGTKTFKFFD